MQEMHGKECEGRFLGVKLDEYSAPGARQDRQDVDMEQGTTSGNGRPERAGRSSGSHKGRQVTVLCSSPKIVLQLRTCSPKVIGRNILQANSSSSSVLAIACDSKLLMLHCMQCGFMSSAVSTLHQNIEGRFVD